MHTHALSSHHHTSAARIAHITLTASVCLFVFVWSTAVADIPLLDAMEARAQWISSQSVACTLGQPTSRPLCAVASYLTRCALLCCVCCSFSLVDSGGRSIPIRIGFHAIPSLRLLHLHLISADLLAPALKKKHHWNSFATAFFVTIPHIKHMLLHAATPAQVGAAALFRPTPSAAAGGGAPPQTFAAQLQARAALEKAQLRCHRCDMRCTNLPELRTHLHMCTKPYPS